MPSAVAVHAGPARPGDHDRLRNAPVPSAEGGGTRRQSSEDALDVFAAAERCRAEETPLVAPAGAGYGARSSRDWAAKGTLLLGARAVLAESFERIHRSNLIGIGVLPLHFAEGTSMASLGLSGEERFDHVGMGSLLGGAGEDFLGAGRRAHAPGRRPPRHAERARALRHGGILRFVLRRLAGAVGMTP